MSRKKGVILSYLGLIIDILSGMIYVPFLLRSLGQAEYGIYSLTTTISSYLLLLDLGVGNALVRYMAKYRVNKDDENQSKFYGLSIIFYTAIFLIAVIVGVILCLIFPSAFSKGLTVEEIKLAQKLLFVTMLNAGFTLLFVTFSKLLIAYEKYTAAKLIDMIKVIVRVSGCTLMLVFGAKSLAITIVNLASTILMGIVTIIYVKSKIKIKPKFKNLQFSFIKEILNYTAFILLQMVVVQINTMTDQILIGALVEASAIILGIYAAGAQICQYFKAIALSVNGIIMPGVVELVENKATTEDIYKEFLKISRILFIILGIIWVGFLINGKYFIELWAGQDASDAYYVALIIMLPLVFSQSQSVGTQILWAMEKHKKQAILQVFVTALNIVLTIFLIKWNPLIGASIGTAISYLVGDVLIMNIIFKKDMNIPIFKYYRELLKGTLICLIISGLCGFAIYFLPLKALWKFIISCSVIVIVYFISMNIFGFNKYEKKLEKKVLHIKEKNV